MMSLWDALRMNMMISYQELVRTFPRLHGVLLMKTVTASLSSYLHTLPTLVSSRHSGDTP
ncbi:hypothetical protein EZ459_10175 [Shigella sonnei]|nr:hypothetical protein [Shigella sonnei]